MPQTGPLSYDSEPVQPLEYQHRAGRSKFLGKLGEVKDRIGEWHVWEELVEIATQVLDHGSPCLANRN